MRKAAILVEGQTEEGFVNRVLRPHLADLDVWLTPIIVQTKRMASGQKYRGGVSKWSKVETDISSLLGGSHWLFVTTMLDYYGLPVDAPGYQSRPASGWDAVDHIERAIGGRGGDGRLIPYLSLHEFEALLFVRPDVVAGLAGDPSLAGTLSSIVTACGAPEAIDDGPDTAPSKRLSSAWPGYSKTTDATAVLSTIGLASIRNSCPHFDGWLTRLEACAGAEPA